MMTTPMGLVLIFFVLLLKISKFICNLFSVYYNFSVLIWILINFVYLGLPKGRCIAFSYLAHLICHGSFWFHPQAYSDVTTWSLWSIQFFTSHSTSIILVHIKRCKCIKKVFLLRIIFYLWWTCKDSTVYAKKPFFFNLWSKLWSF